MSGPRATASKRTSSVALAAIPIAGHVSSSGCTPGLLSGTRKSRSPSPASARTSACVRLAAPEHHRRRPSRRQPEALRAARSASTGPAVQTPKRPAGSSRPASWAIASASRCPSARRASERSNDPRSSRIVNRLCVSPSPGKGASRTPLATSRMSASTGARSSSRISATRSAVSACASACVAASIIRVAPRAV